MSLQPPKPTLPTANPASLGHPPDSRLRAARVRFRPHHFLCALGYQGKGYSDRFTANMSAIVLGRLRAPDGGRTIIEVTGATDDICAPCPKRRGDHCMSQVQIAALDSRHAAALGLAPGDRLTWAEAQVRIRHRVHADDLDRLCRGCGWLALGLCKAALRSLTGPTDRDTAP